MVANKRSQLTELPHDANEAFRKFSTNIASVLGSSWAFAVAFVIIISWIFTGPLFDYSDTWQLVINTATSVVTFLMVFIIQNTQNRDTKAIQLKLDELLVGVKDARTGLVGLEDLSDAQIEQLHAEFQVLHEKHRKQVLQDKNIENLKKDSTS